MPGPSSNAASSSGATQEELLPIDIYYSKLLEWLVSRKKVIPEWQAHVLPIREKITSAVQDMPDVPEITSLLRGSYINYFHAVRIVDLLKVSESGSKNIFGQYSSKRMKDWAEIVRMYEKGFVYLGECAHMIIQNVNYEVSAMKKAISKTQQQLKELDVKESLYLSNANQYRAEFHVSCRDLKIEIDADEFKAKGANVNLKEKLGRLVKELAPLYTSLVDAVREKRLVEACELYRAFLDFTLGAGGGRTSATALAMLSYLQLKGNVTVHEWRTGEQVDVSESDLAPPYAALASATATPEASTPAAPDSEADEIDWNAVSTDGLEEATGEISWDVDAPADGSGAADVDRGDSDSSAAAASSDGIEWGIETVVEGDVTKSQEEQAAPVSSESAIIVEVDAAVTASSTTVSAQGTASHGKVSKETILENTETRNLFINDLLELQGFLTQRLSEANLGTSVISINMFSTGPKVLQDQSPGFLGECLAAVQKILNSLTKSRAQQLILIKTSPRYVDHLADTLHQKLKSADRMDSKAKQVVEKRKELTELIQSTHQQMSELIAQTKVLQKQVEGELSKLYGGRKVNIIGEINTL